MIEFNNEQRYWLSLWAMVFTTLIILALAGISSCVYETKLYTENGFTKKLQEHSNMTYWTKE